jgi:hypothetical protein
VTIELPDAEVGQAGSSPARRRPVAPRWLVPVLLFLCFGALYAVTRSISLDDFDSFNFARAIDHFDVRLNQPQPPGYPVYIFLARLLDLAVHNHQMALTLLSAICGAGAVLAFYSLARDLEIGWAAIPLAVTPLFWLGSAMALSDVPGLAFAMTSVFVVHRAVRNGAHAPPGPRRSVVRAFLAGCALAGLAAGVRPQDAVVPVSVILFWAAPRLWRGSRVPSPPPGEDAQDQGLRVRALLAWGTAAFISACLSWAIPLTLSFPSVSSAWSTMVSQSLYVGSTDSLLARPLTLANMAARLAEFGSVFSAYFGGPRAGALPAFLALTGAVMLLFALARRGRWLALAWLLPYAAVMLLTMRPDDPRKVLPAIPPMLLLLAGIRPRALAAAICLGLAGWQAAVAAPLITTLDTVPAPPEQAAAFLQAHFSPADTLVVAGQSYNAIRYRLPAFKVYLLDELDPAAVNRDLASGTYRNLVLLDKEGFAPPESYAGVGTRTFMRDALVLPKASTVWLAAYRPLSELRETDLSLPSTAVHIGTPEDVRYLMDGWYRPEQIAGVPARWTDLSARIRFWTDRAGDASLELVAAAYPDNQQLTVLVNNQPAARLSLAHGWAPYTISIPASLLHAGAINTISLEHRTAISAYQATDGQSLDRRPLAAAYSSFQLRWK